MTTSRIVLSSFFVIGLVACSGFGESVDVGSNSDKLGADGGGGGGDGGGGSADGGGGPCLTASDCGAGLWVCAFAADSKCGDHGVCISVQGVAQCAAYSPGCSCGNNVNMACNGIPNGYLPGPAAKAGECGGAQDASVCTKDEDCDSTHMCGFIAANACTATGSCYPRNTGALCNSAQPGCACDGTTINTVCEGYPDGVVSKPLAHTGACP